jgi:hypothetical protein
VRDRMAGTDNDIDDIDIDTINYLAMTKLEDIIAQMRANPANIRFADLKKVCGRYFGQPRQEGTSHCVYRTPWPGDPRVNIQEGKGGKAKDYQVRQVVQAIGKIEDTSDGN